MSSGTNHSLGTAACSRGVGTPASSRCSFSCRGSRAINPPVQVESYYRPFSWRSTSPHCRRRDPMERLLLRPVEAAEAIGVSRSKIYELLASGDLPSVRIGASVRVPVDALRAWIAEQLDAGRV